MNSPSGNRTPVSRVTGGDTHHYTNEDWKDYDDLSLICILYFFKFEIEKKLFIMFKKKI